MFEDDFLGGAKKVADGKGGWSDEKPFKAPPHLLPVAPDHFGTHRMLEQPAKGSKKFAPGDSVEVWSEMCGSWMLHGRVIDTQVAKNP